MPTTFMPIANFTFTSAVNSVTFNSISQAYNDLVITINAGNSGTTGFGGVYNNDTGSNYVTTYTGGYGTNIPGSASTAVGNYSNFAPSSWTDTSIGIDYNINILDYSQTNKQKYFLSRVNGQAAGSYTSINNGRWTSTAAINSIKIFGLNSSTFSIGSTIAIYGVIA